MSEGEKKAIEILTTYKNQILDRKPFTYSFIDMQWAIGAILDLYTKEKEKNKELEQYKKYYQNERNLLDSYISKDKIKEKIEQLIKEADYKTNDNPVGRVHFHKEPVDYQIEALKELLEEEK